MTSTAFFTDQYEITMLDAALRAGVAEIPTVFEVSTRQLPPDRRYGVFAGLGRLLPAIEAFRFGPGELEWLAAHHIVSEPALEWLARYRFSGNIVAYREGEIYTGGSPLLTVEGTFAEAVLLETLVLSILNHDSAVAAAASLVAQAAGDRPVIEMGGRRTDHHAAVAAARAAYIGGLASTSNLEAGRTYGIPTAGTVAHAFVLLFDDEIDAYAAQVQAFGPDTTVLVDTYDMEAGIRRAVQAVGPSLGAVRIDSGDPVVESRQARALLDSLGATRTKVIVTGDLDAASIAALAACPVDGYGAGTSVVMGLGHPTAGLIYKVVTVDGRSVAKRSPGKQTFGGRKWARRLTDRGEELVVTAAAPVSGPGRSLQSLVMDAGRPVAVASVEEARRHHQRALSELPSDRPLTLVRSPAAD